MSIKHAAPNEVIDVGPWGDQLPGHQTSLLFKSKQLEVLRLVLPAGKIITEHKAPGEITVQCLEGRIAFTAGGKTQELIAGQMLYLTSGEPHALAALAPSSALVTIVLAPKALEPKT